MREWKITFPEMITSHKSSFGTSSYTAIFSLPDISTFANSVLAPKQILARNSYFILVKLKKKD